MMLARNEPVQCSDRIYYVIEQGEPRGWIVRRSDGAVTWHDSFTGVRRYVEEQGVSMSEVEILV